MNCVGFYCANMCGKVYFFLLFLNFFYEVEGLNPRFKFPAGKIIRVSEVRILQ